MALRVRELARAARAPLGAVLEGGYAPAALGASVRETLDALAADASGGVAPAPVLPLTARAGAAVARHWPLDLTAG